MKKYIDEFFDELERILKPVLIYSFFILILIIISDYLQITSKMDIKSLKEIKSLSEIKIKLFSNKEIMLYFIFDFLLNLYALMGLWGTLFKKEKSEIKDFFYFANKNFFKGLCPYFIITSIPILISSLFLLSYIYKSSLLGAFSLTISFFIILLLFKLIFWEAFIYKDNVSGIKSLKLSFIATNNRLLNIILIIFFPVFLFSSLGSMVTWKILVYFFTFINLIFLPISIEIIKFMIFKRIIKEEIKN